jgi:signal transduction histidine kinase/ActR/RegA family two-component response regulator
MLKNASILHIFYEISLGSEQLQDRKGYIMKKDNMKKKMLFAALPLLFVISIVSIITGKIIANNNKEIARYEAENKATEITRIIESYAHDLNIWGALLDEFGEKIVEDNFEELAENIYGYSNNSRCVQLAPKGVVTYLHPYEGNEEAFGHDLFADPEREEEATLARETGEVIVSGPLTLKQGGKGLISRKPIYSNVSDEEDHFWGFVMIVLDLDVINEEFGLESYEFKNYEYRLYRKNGENITVATESTSQTLTDPVEVEVSIPTNIIWKLSVQPKEGWVSREWASAILLSDILVFILGMTYIYFYFQRKYNLEKDKEQKIALAKALSEAKEANNAKSDFLRRMSHDIRTPINGIIGMTAIALKDTSNPKKVEDCLHKIEESSKHLSSLVNDVLDMNKIESGQVSVNEIPFDIIATAEKCCSIIRGELIKKNIEFITDFEKMKHSALIGDAVHLERIIVNILGNSVKFTKEGGKIIFRLEEISADGENVQVRMQFHDTGVGMNKEFLPKIFDLFTQDIDNSRTSYQGTGLGMPITKQFVEMLNGKIDVKSEKNVGTDFTVLLPFAINHSVKGRKEKEEREFTLAGCKILLVEDNEINAEIAEDILENEGAEITIAQNGKIAVDICANSEESYFSLILMDIMMPEMDGLTATREIRCMNRKDMQTVPIIALTANAFVNDRNAAMEAGMNGYVTKPIDVDALLKEIEEVFKKLAGN